MKWTVDFTNDPERDYELCAEFNFGDDRGVCRIGRSDGGEIILTVFAGPTVRIPWELLAEVAAEMKRDTAHLYEDKEK